MDGRVIPTRSSHPLQTHPPTPTLTPTHNPKTHSPGILLCETSFSKSRVICCSRHEARLTSSGDPATSMARAANGVSSASSAV